MFRINVTIYRFQITRKTSAVIKFQICDKRFEGKYYVINATHSVV